MTVKIVMLRLGGEISMAFFPLFDLALWRSIIHAYGWA